MKSLGKIFGTILISVIGFAAGFERANGAETVRIGTFLAITGQGSFLGAPALATLRLFVDLVNAQGGLLGRQLELIQYDTGIDTKSAQTAVRELIQIHKVDVIIGGSTTGATMAVIPMVEKAGVPFISLADSVSIIDPVRKWVFKTSPTDAIACARIFLDMKKRGIKRVGLISGDGGFGKSMRSHCLRLAKPFGLSIVADEVYKSNSRRFSAQLKRLRANGKIQAVLNLGFASSPAYITRSYRKMKFKPPLYQSHGVATADYLEIAGKSADGVRMPVAPMIVADHLAADDPVKKVIATYRRYYEKRWEAPASVYGSHAYDAMQIYVNAVRKVGSLDKIKVRQRIENTRGLVGANGIFRMSAANHLGLDISSFHMAEIKSGKWVLAD